MVDVDPVSAHEVFVTIHCGGVPQRYDSTTVIIFHTKRNAVVPNAPENALLDRINTGPNVDLNNSLLSIVDSFIERVPRFYDTATRITMITDRKGVTDYTFEEEQERVPFYPEAMLLPKRIRTVSITDLTKHEALSSFADIVIWRGERVVFNRTSDDCDAFMRHVGALSKRMSQRFVTITAIVIDSKELLRGYIIPFYSLGNLSQVFLGSGATRPSFSPFDSSLKLKWSQELARGVADAHASSYTLGNLCPSHILVKDTGDILVNDLSQVMSDNSRGWAAPEVLSARNGENMVTKGSDVYSLGAMLWAIGFGPRTAASWSAVPRNFQERWGAGCSVPEWFRQVVERCLEVDPARRPGAPEVLQALLHDGNGLV